MAESTGPNLSQTELKMLAAAFLSFETPPKPNYESIAAMCGYKNAGTAAVMFRTLRRKIESHGNGGEKPAKKATKGTKRAAADADGDGKPKKRGRSAKAVKQESATAGDNALTNADGDEEEEETAEDRVKSEQQDDHSDED